MSAIFDSVVRNLSICSPSRDDQLQLQLTPHIEPPDNATVSITFQPSLRADDRLPDTAIISSNHVYFYVHRHRLLAASSNGFAGRFFDPQIGFGGFLPTIYVPESGDVLNVVLHTMYDRSCVHFYPSLETVEAALTALGKYGVAVDAYAAPGQPVFQLLTSHAPYRPIETYALAGQYGLEDVAVVVSGHLLPFDLSSLTDDIAIKMGPVYLKRLVLLHQSRLNHLRNIILEPPARHPPTAECGEVEQGKLTSAWAHASAQFVWDASPSKIARRSLSFVDHLLRSTHGQLDLFLCRHLGQLVAHLPRAHRREHYVRVLQAQINREDTECGCFLDCGQGAWSTPSSSPPPPNRRRRY